jgi:hypothetical protein
VLVLHLMLVEVLLGVEGRSTHIAFESRSCRHPILFDPPLPRQDNVHCGTETAVSSEDVRTSIVVCGGSSHPRFEPGARDALLNVTERFSEAAERPDLDALERTLAEAIQLASHPNQAIGAFLVALCHHLQWVAGIFYVVDPGAARMLTPTHEVHLREETRLRALQLIAARPPGEDLQGLGGRVLDTGEIALIPDIGKEEHFLAREYADLLRLRGAVAVPLYVGERLGAVAEFFSTQTMSIDGETRAAIERVAQNLGAKLATIPLESEDLDLGQID